MRSDRLRSTRSASVAQLASSSAVTLSRVTTRGARPGSPLGRDHAEALRRPVPGALRLGQGAAIELGCSRSLAGRLARARLRARDLRRRARARHRLPRACALLIWIAVLRHRGSLLLAAATLTPVGPLGSVIAIDGAIVAPAIVRDAAASGDRGQSADAARQARDRRAGADRATRRRPTDAGRGSRRSDADVAHASRATRPRTTPGEALQAPEERWRGGAVGGRGSTRPAPRLRVGSQGGMPTRSPPEAGLAGDEPSN